MTDRKWINWLVLIVLAVLAVTGPAAWSLGKDFDLVYFIPLFWWVLGCGWRQVR